jgi:hypothetical protein
MPRFKLVTRYIQYQYAQYRTILYTRRDLRTFTPKKVKSLSNLYTGHIVCHRIIKVKSKLGSDDISKKLRYFVTFKKNLCACYLD